MAYYLRLPAKSSQPDPRYLNIVDGESSAGQRALRRGGLAGFEPPTMAALMTLFDMQEPGFTFVDVGANIGIYSALCSALFEPSEVVAFEPTPRTASITRKIARVNRAITRVEQIALGDTPGSAPLYLSARSDASNSMVEGFKKNTGTVEVAVETLDDYVEANKITPNVMKIDAESFEPQILAGARDVLATHRPVIVIEVLNHRGRDHGDNVAAVMREHGYFYYACSTYSDWEPHATIVGDKQEARNWLLSPVPLPADFQERFEVWETVLSACDRDHNLLKLPSNVPAAGESDSHSFVHNFTARARAFLGHIRRAVKRRPT